MKILQSLTKLERMLWGGSVALILGTFYWFGGGNDSTLLASLIGVTSLIFCAKGHPIGQFLMVLFSLFYGLISLSCAYYGEMLTYLGMTMPMAVASLVSWLRHPSKEGTHEVQVGRVGSGEMALLFVLAIGVSAVFYFILAYWHTANLEWSTVSVATSFMAAALTFRRSPYYALAYAANDLVLIVLWVLAAMENASYGSVVVCFAAFFVNDLYGFWSWRNRQRRQNRKF